MYQILSRKFDCNFQQTTFHVCVRNKVDYIRNKMKIKFIMSSNPTQTMCTRYNIM